MSPTFENVEQLAQALKDNKDLAKVNVPLKINTELKSDSVKPKRVVHHTERDFQQAIIETAKLTGWAIHAERPAWTKKGYRTPIQGDAGFVDLVLTRDGKLIFWEVKVRPNEPTTHQQLWIDALAQVPGVMSDVVYLPEDWDYIVHILTAKLRLGE